MLHLVLIQVVTDLDAKNSSREATFSGKVPTLIEIGTTLRAVIAIAEPRR